MTTDTKPTVLGIGELLWDCFATGRRPGGAPGNFAFHVNQLGMHGIVCSAVGQDELGAELLQFLRDHQLDTDAIQIDSEHPTSTVSVDTTQPDNPIFTIHENIAWDFITWNETLEKIAKTADAICFGTLAQRSTTSRMTIQEVLEAASPECLKIFDINLRQHYYSQALIETCLSRVTLVKLNDGEAALLSQAFNVSGGLVELCRWICQTFGPKRICVTRGADGCLIYDHATGQAVEAVGKPVQVADTVGSGDAFTAAWICATLRGWPLEKQADFANALGGFVASQVGGMPTLPENWYQG